MKRVLIVDDEKDIVESLAIMLTKHGYQVVTASGGADGLAAVEREKPDLVLCDVMMPAPDGFEVCRRIKSSEKTESIPVLLITALNQTEDKVKGLEAGADDFVSKPFNDAELRARVAAFLRTKALRDEVDESYRKLKELEGMRDALAGMIVHDLKVPLTAVKGGLEVFLNYLESDPKAPADMKKLVTNAHGSSKRMVSLIQDILDVSRMEQAGLPLKKTAANLNALVRDVAKSMAPLAEASNVGLEIVLPPSDLFAPADASLIERVLTNLVSNSLKFTEKGKVTIGLRALPDHVELMVSDTGIGIPKEHVEKIFDKFFQSDGHEVTRKGQGLGLAFCRLAVDAHGGKIWAESEKGKGSRFFVRLPA